MEITLNIPERLAAQFLAAGEDPVRAALEALAVEGYRTERISEFEVRQMLGFENRMEVHRFLKEHGAYLHYSLADLEKDEASSLRFRMKQQQRSSSGEHCAE